MEQYIKQLIQQKNRVNIPGFGAFIVSNDGSGNIVFNQYLNFDDGVLNEYVMSQKNISKEEASTEINTFVDSIKEKLNSGESFEIENLGIFKQIDGKINFEKATDGNVQETNSNDNGSGIELEFEDPQPEISKNEDSDPKIEQMEEVNNNASTEEISSEKQEPDKETTATTNIYVEENKNSKTWIYVLIIILLFLIIAFVCLFVINKDNCVYRFFCGEEKVEVVEPVVVKEPQVEVKDTVVVEQQTPNANPLEKRYNIVVGCYKSMELAEKRVEALKAKGFDKAFATALGEWYAAIIESHSSLVEAEARQEEIVDNYRIESWITNSGE